MRLAVGRGLRGGDRHKKTRRLAPAGKALGQLSKGPSVRATNETQEDSDDGDDQQCVDDPSGVIAEVANGPEDDENHGDNVKNASHRKCFKVFLL